MTRNRRTAHRPRQEGFTLVMGLIFLVLLTLLGLTAMRMAGLEERMSGNTRDRILAFNAAEAGLRHCERELQAAVLPAFNNAAGRYQPAAAGSTPRWETVDWSNNAQVYTAAAPSGASSAPRCIIEELPTIPGSGGGSLKGGMPLPDTGVFRVTARGVGRSASTTIMVQSTYIR